MKRNLNSERSGGDTSDSLVFSKLTYDDIPEISKLLVMVWPLLYGAVGHPHFNVDYLRWIYGGPNKNKHMMIGARINNTLIAYQSFLFRSIYYDSKALNAYLWTHATVSPELSGSARVHCAIQMMKQAVQLFDRNASFFIEDCDLIYAFNEIDKHTREVVDKVFKKHYAIDRKINSTFNQFIVMPNKLKKYLNETGSNQNSFNVRAVTEQDSQKLADLFSIIPQGSQFVMQMTGDELKHYFFSSADHQTHAIAENGEFKALIHFFPVQIIKESKTHLDVIVEFLVSDPVNKKHAAHLLSKAVDFAEKINAKAVVLENANYLDYNVFQPMGLLPTLRKMTMSAISRQGAFDYEGSFRCDVK